MRGTDVDLMLEPYGQTRPRLSVSFPGFGITVPIYICENCVRFHTMIVA